MLEKSVQLTSKAWDRESMGTVNAQAGDAAMPGDCLWPLANMLWRIYAEVHWSCRSYHLALQPEY